MESCKKFHFYLLKHQGFVDDFDYGDDQDDQQRMEEKKRQLEQEANRLKNARFENLIL